MTKQYSNYQSVTESTWIIHFENGCKEYSDQLSKMIGEAIRQMSFDINDDKELGKEVMKVVNAALITYRKNCFDK